MSGLKVYSIHGRGLKLDSKEDIEPYLKELQALTNVEEIHIGGKCANRNAKITSNPA
jgi:Ran GTPase-activating protein 1